VSRIEGKISGKGKEPVDAAEILAALAKQGIKCAEARRNAVRRYLSASDGWEEASSVLGGAFADPATWLRSEKDE
jgi:hypothetical protein